LSHKNSNRLAGSCLTTFPALGVNQLTHRAENGDAYCSMMDCVLVPEPDKDATWDGTEFFD